MKRTVAALLLALGLAGQVIAQAPPPVPALPDTQRLTTYSISGTTCACSVGFAIYGDSTDVDEWIQVWVAGVQYLSTDPAHGWSLSSPTGSLGSIARPITDAVLTFNQVQTGTVQIVGARRPRRVSQFSENRGVPARDLNQAITDLVAQNREQWDLINRALLGQPGEVLQAMPGASTRAGKFLYFDNTGLIPQFTTGGAGSGNVVGPISSTIGDLACWNNTSGTLVADCGGWRTATGNDTILTTDCWKTVQEGTGSTGFFSVTLPAVTGFPAGCRVLIKNGDSASGKRLIGFPSDAYSKLYPLQAIEVQIVNGAWVTTRKPPRWQITANTTFYLNKDSGTDTNDCLSTGAACATSAQIMTDVAQAVDNQATLTFQWGCAATPCTFTDLPFLAKNYVGSGQIVLQGDTTTPDNYVMTCSAACVTGLFRFSSGSSTNYLAGIWTVQGFKTTTSVAGIYAIFLGSTMGVHVYFQNMDFGSLSNTGASLGCSQQGQINDLGNYTISGNAGYFADIEDGCILHLTSGTGTLTGTPAFSQVFLYSHGAGAIIGTNSAQFSGAATGKRCAADLLALIDTAGTSASLPGNSACTATSGAYVN